MNLSNFQSMFWLAMFWLAAGLMAVSSAVHAQAPTRQSVRQVAATTDTLREEFSFTLKDFTVDHQGELNRLNIAIRYTYKPGIQATEYPNFIPLAREVEQFLTNYPNEATYWEIVNKELTAMVLAKYPVLSSITAEIEVAPSSRHPFTRASRVTRQRSEPNGRNGRTPLPRRAR